MISMEDLGGEYYDRVFSGEDGDSDMDMSNDDMRTNTNTFSLRLSLDSCISDALARTRSSSFSLKI